MSAKGRRQWGIKKYRELEYLSRSGSIGGREWATMVITLITISAVIPLIFQSTKNEIDGVSVTNYCVYMT